MSKRYNLINFGYLPWNAYWKRNQTIFHYASKENYIEKALYVNPGVWASDYLFRPSLFRNELDRKRLHSIIPRRIDEKIRVYTPVFLPGMGRSEHIRRMNNAVLHSVIGKYLDRPLILLVNNPSAAMKVHIDLLMEKARITVFDWSDDFAEYNLDSGIRRRGAEICDDYIRRADLVIAVNDYLSGRAKQLNPNSYTLRNATNFFLFEKENGTAAPEATRPAHALLGYTGWINKHRIDEEIVRHLAINRPEWTLLFVGPKSQPQPMGSEIRDCSNIRFHPAVPYEKMIEIIKTFDVCILPNRINAHTAGNDPIKIYDYLASGKPIVSTKTSGTEVFKGHIYLAGEKQEFLECVEKALAEDSRVGRERRRAAGRENSWEVRYREFSRLIDRFV